MVTKGALTLYNDLPLGLDRNQNEENVPNIVSANKPCTIVQAIMCYGIISV
jgi:hypothetical protein